ncbi:MAG: hypothetical protein JO074_06145 [Frankiales bacterium]|nr:hypothetical protein [Frankiales bacterium]
MAHSFRSSASITVPLPPAEAMEFFTPEGERNWAGAGWDPHYPDPDRQVGAGAVFTTRHGGRETFWVMTVHTPRRVAYTRVTPGALAGTVAVEVTAETAGSTTVSVTYDLTALTPAAAGELAHFADGYDDEIASWATHIERAIGRLSS